MDGVKGLGLLGSLGLDNKKKQRAREIVFKILVYLGRAAFNRKIEA